MNNQKTNTLNIEYTFDAPREKVWKVFTEAEHLKHWWGPKYFTAPFINLDLCVNGKYLYSMHSTYDGKDYWSTGIFKEIVPMERLVMSDSFADEKGNVVPASYYGMSPDFPMEMLVTLTFEEADGKTKVKLMHEGMPPSDIEGARQGWTQSLDKLAEHLKEMS